MYQLNTQDGYIISLAKGTDNGNITEEQYNEIKAKLDTRPTPPEGYYYRLTTGLVWVICELPPVVDGMEE